MKHWTKIEKKRKKYIMLYFRKVRSDLKAMALPVLDFVKEHKHVDHLELYLDSLIDTTELEKTLMDLYIVVGSDFGKNVTDQIVEKKMGPDEMRMYMETFALNEVGKKVKSIKSVTRQEYEKILKQELEYGLENGLGIEEISDRFYVRLKGEWTRQTYWRALRISQTEVIGASNRGSFEAARNSGYQMTKTWLTAPIGVAKTERHALPGAIQSETVAMEAKFLVDGGQGYREMDCPGDDNGGPENVINCRCSISYEVI